MSVAHRPPPPDPTTRRVGATDTAGAGPRERGFILLAAGQIASMLGTVVTSTGLSIVAFVATGSVWWLSGLYLAARLPALLVSAHAGRAADRGDRRRIMLLADAAAGIATLAALLLHVAGLLTLTHLVGLALVGSLANAYQEAAFQSAIPRLVPAERLDRAHGLLQLGPALGLLAGPALAGVLVATVGIGGVLAVDLVTFALAIAATVRVRFGTAPRSTDDTTDRGRLVDTWRHLTGRRQGLRRLITVAAVANLVVSTTNVLLFALLLPLVGEAGAGIVLSIGAAAMLATGVAVSARGLPARRMRTIAAALGVGGLGLVLMGLRADAVVVTLGVAVLLSSSAVVGAAASTVFQTEVPSQWQGRLTALRRVAGEALVPVGVLLVAPLVEQVAEPALAADGPLASSIGTVIGVGPGRGVALVFVCVGLLLTALAVVLDRDRLAAVLDRPAIPTDDETRETGDAGTVATG